jgi:hypothetical protein
MYAVSCGELFGYTGVETAPTWARAKSNSDHSSAVRAKMAKDSPFRTPRASRPFARFSTRSAASDHVTVCQ